MTNTPVRTAIVGCGSMARGHIRGMLNQVDTTRIRVVCEPSADAYAEVCQLYADHNLAAPLNEPDLEKLLTQYGADLDAAFIITPHAYHYAQTAACLEAGLDVLLEKPMVITAQEAESLIEIRDRTERLLVVAFPGSLSPEIRTAVKMFRNNELGDILNIAAVTWEGWKVAKAGTWRLVPNIAGGGFFFDTGAHLLNTVSDLADKDFVEVAAWLDNRGTEVDILGAVIARLANGALVTFNACGDTIPSCSSDIRVFCTNAILRTGMWGRFLEIQWHGSQMLEPVPMPTSMGVWEQFLAVRSGQMPNPSPPEVGLRMARLWDAIKNSAAQGGQPVLL